MFDALASSTPCPYAPQAKYEIVELAGTSRRDLRDATSQVIEALPRCEADGFDMIVIEMGGVADCQDIVSLARRTGDLLECLKGHRVTLGTDPNLLSPQWRLEIAGVRLFPLTFASFYPPLHPRRSDAGYAHLVLQLTAGFRNRFGLMSAADFRIISNRVRKRFELAGFEYFSDVTQDGPRALRLIKPLDPGDPPVKWWEYQ